MCPAESRYWSLLLFDARLLVVRAAIGWTLVVDEQPEIQRGLSNCTLKHQALATGQRANEFNYAGLERTSGGEY